MSDITVIEFNDAISLAEKEQEDYKLQSRNYKWSTEGKKRKEEIDSLIEALKNQRWERIKW